MPKTSNKMNAMNKSRGFTMIELMVVIAIVAILTTLAAPSFKSLIQSNSMSSAVNAFLGDMRYARSESIRRGGGVVMCRSDNPESTNAQCGSGSTVGWESGWIIFHNLNSGNQRNITGTNIEPLIRVQGPIASVNTIAESGAASIFKFTATGRLTLTSSTSIQFGSNPPFATDAQRIVCVNVGGRARISLDSTGKATGNASCSTDQ
jgi:type IV fimbrial biogenesis protein FimT